MSTPHDDPWLDSMLQRRLPSALSEEGFSLRVLEQLPQRPSRTRRALTLGAIWGAALTAPWLTAAVAGWRTAMPVGDITLPVCLGTTLLWYLVLGRR